MGKIKAKIISSLEKVLPNSTPEQFNEISEISVLTNERLNIQILLYEDEPFEMHGTTIVNVKGIDNGFSMRNVENIIANLPCYPFDDSIGTDRFIRSENNIYPDILAPLDSGNRIFIQPGTKQILWFEFTPSESGHKTVMFSFKHGEEIIAECKLEINVINSILPKSSLIFTEWFHCDCLASYYRVNIFSEEHWKIIENYMRTAVRNGITCILTPIFTPPLDTEIGSERPTVQLVDISRKDNHYSFCFSKLKRWIKLARKCGISYFEISHLFTQWGALYAPKIIAETENGYERIFGWDTPGTEGEYPVFLQSFLPELVNFLKEEGIIEKCRFHVSDEPNSEQLEGYIRAKNVIAPFLEGYKIIDAISNIEFYKTGAITIPVPAVDHIEPFLDEKIDERWTYYCCGQYNRVSNRFIAYPSFRNRIIGIQLYKFDIKGFLQWGYNFFYSMGSRRLINPFTNQSGDCWVPSGDTFSVYPAADGTAIESIRIAVFYEAIQDYMALKECENIIGREKTIELIDSLAGEKITFTDYPDSNEFILSVRKKINKIIESHKIK